MLSIDNIIVWNGSCVGEQSVESIDGETGLYVFATDLVGDRPVDVISASSSMAPGKSEASSGRASRYWSDAVARGPPCAFSTRLGS
jgi:hypothetical protein